MSSSVSMLWQHLNAFAFACVHPPLTASAALFIAIALQQLLFGGMWLILAWKRLSRRASAWWALTSGLIALSAGLISLRGQIEPWLGLVVANAVLMLGFITLRQGLDSFLRKPISWRHVPWVLGGFVLLLTLLHRHGSQTLVASVSAALWAVMIGHVGWIIARQLRGEFGTMATLCALPMAGVSAMFFVRATSMALDAADHVVPSAGGGTPMALAIGVMLLALNMTLVGLVVVRIVLRLRHQSEHDGLTGLLNRRSIEQQLELEAQRTQRYGGSFAVLSIDIDHFKRVNDTRGHPGGDEVLRKVAATLRRMARQVDAVARAGGEEFWVLLPATDMPGALNLAERMRRAVSQSGLGITVSIGVAVSHGSQETLNALLRRMDAALYRAKREGRDRVVQAEPSPEAS